MASWNVDVRNVLVSGATRGLGLAITRGLVEGGYRVCGASRKRSDAFDALAEAFPGQLMHIAADLGDTRRLRDVVVEAKSLGGPIYGLVNNAGLGTDGLLSNMHASQIEALITLNVTAPIMLAKYAVRSMMTSGEGRIINMSSIIATTGYSAVGLWRDEVSDDRFYKVPRAGSRPPWRDRERDCAWFRRHRAHRGPGR